MDQQNETNATEAGTAPGGKFSKAREFVGDKYSAASDTVKKTYGDVREKVTDTYGQVKEKVDDINFAELGEKARGYVRANPGKALLISIGVGFIIGLLLRRGDED